MVNSTATATDWMISVDDHVIEPPNVWRDRLPAKYRDVGPRIIDGRRRRVLGLRGQAGAHRRPGASPPASAHEDFISPEAGALQRHAPGCYDPVARLADMDRAGILASLCFPSFPRFCGQIFWEAKDKDLALLCVQAYNDWMIDEWCGAAPGRSSRDHHSAVGPARRPRRSSAARPRAPRAFAFSENPEPLGLPTIHDPAATGIR